MKGFFLSGSLFRPMADVWQWIDSQLEEPDWQADLSEVSRLRFSRVSHTLELIFEDDRVPIQIELDAFWSWVERTWVPEGVFQGEKVYGRPVVKDDYLIITFAVASEIDPRATPTGEAVLAEWESEDMLCPQADRVSRLLWALYHAGKRLTA